MVKEEEDLFCIRNRFQNSVDFSVPVLGSRYGNQPYRSFCEQTVPPPCAGHRTQHPLVRQHFHQHHGQLPSQRFFRSGADCALLLLRRRPRRRIVSLCSGQGYSRDLARSGADCTGFLLRRRPRRRIVSLRSGQSHSRDLARSGVDRTGFLLRRRPRRRIVSLRSAANGNFKIYALMSFGRFSRRDGQ